MLIGVELDDSRVTAVAVTENGEVRARATEAVTGGDFARPGSAVLERVRSPDGGPIGFAATTPAAEEILAAVRAICKGAAPAITASGTAAAVAETWLGAARGASEVVFFAIGDRTSGGLVRGGTPMFGARGRAGSIGWMSLNPVEREDYRKIGCVEAEVAANGIVRRLIWRIKAGDRSTIQDVVNNELSEISVRHVLDAARSGDGVAVSVVRDTAKYLGMSAANLVAVADPEVLVLGGLIASAADLLLEPVRTEISRRLPPLMLDGLAIVPALLGNDAAAIGAARIGATRR
jgi:glucokinase